MLTCCNQCKHVKPADCFYVSNPAKCKECVKHNVRENRAGNVEHYRAFDRARANDPQRVAARKAYQKTEQGKAAAAKAKKSWNNSNPKKRRANCAVNSALKSGKLSKPSYCESCSVHSHRLEGHHDDYDKHLDVRWMCSQCHRDWHKQNGEAANAA